MYALFFLDLMTGLFFQEISTVTNIPKLELDCVLRSLVLGTSFRKVLKKEPQEMELDGSVFFVNDHDFKSNLAEIPYKKVCSIIKEVHSLVEISSAN